MRIKMLKKAGLYYQALNFFSDDTRAKPQQHLWDEAFLVVGTTETTLSLQAVFQCLT